MSDYNLSDSYEYGGGFDAMGTADYYARTLVGTHYMIVSAILIVMVLFMIMHFRKHGFEMFSPSVTFNAQSRDDREHLSACDSVGYKGDAWEWQNKALAGSGSEAFTQRPKTDNDFTKILSGM